ncbi:UbiX family flavin prenyltransferase [Parvibaculum sp.]|jgi:4-hydroxy-3-polyprenylbenzoate decarboxylase|uniref:UbiX family flavin prenyltransferase n=1 Tax=Parvibaculum sp. TaxID=2024848 RepID=UPI001B09704A|nr:UbiX family flavin prenyltransferase [Parvibaculum sp.]MBO6635855.1 UbiX family flavin prenyltransferase [Parvibaculum sp.]MBO6679451.1 UbiX family flavin prenyltransferase [Parvibaculum sp.]MBO6684998.1 UbiX family flavin prenyltransferase [Parvibaculum sp.]MBO6904876.1 UbiX family flavin prenyltransferase [Parvibaculum sp.]
MAGKNPTPSQNPRLIVGISGASGVAYGVRVLELLKDAGVESHLVITRAAEMTLGYETGVKAKDLDRLAHTRYRIEDIGAAIASGSFGTLGMIVAPCSVRTMSEIATGVTSSLLTRAADVVLKERRRLVLMVRETPLHTGHLRTMTQLSEIGAIIAPPVPGLYAKPKSVDDLVTQTAARTLDLFGLDLPAAKRWGEDLKDGRRSPVRAPKEKP